jgi:hypothetical protein
MGSREIPILKFQITLGALSTVRLRISFDVAVSAWEFLTIKSNLVFRLYPES